VTGKAELLYYENRRYTELSADKPHTVFVRFQFYYIQISRTFPCIPKILQAWKVDIISFNSSYFRYLYEFCYSCTKYPTK